VALEVHYNTALAVFHEPPDGTLATTSTAVVYRADGTTLETLGTTNPAAGSKTIASGSTTAILNFSSTTAVTVGHKWRTASDGLRHVFEVARVNTLAVHLLDPLAVVPDTGSTVEPIRITATIAAPGVAEVGNNLRLEWLYDDGTVEGFGSDTVQVVRWKWNTPITAARIRKHLAFAFPAVVDSREAHYWQSIADEANDEIRKLVQATGRRPHLYGDPDAFKRSGLLAAKHLLAGEGIVPPGSNPGIFMEQMRADFEREVGRVIGSLETYDADGDGKISTDEAKGLWFSILTVR
jgi:hypothetical protein